MSSKKAGGEPSSKRQKTDDPSLEDVQKAIEKLDACQEEIEKINEDLAKEIMELEYKYEKKKAAPYAKRAEIIKGIPNFWAQAILNHPVIGEMVYGRDQEILKHLKDVNVKSTSATDFQIELSFEENPFFSNTKIWKRVKYESSDFKSENSDIKWKPDSKMSKEDREADGSVSFFDWFLPEEVDSELAREFKDTLWANPIKYYMSLDLDDDEVELDSDDLAEDDEDEDDDDDEE